ncbi:MAG TPA: hypothetical protein VH092_10015, partial [Urbifossiella sp.]|nr:hypothetical protein [Urbifossiella sp.]
MTPVPSARFLAAAAALGAAAFGLLIFPGAWPALVAADLALLLVAAVDLAASPRRAAVRAERLAPERMSVREEQRVVVRVENRSRVWLRVKVRDAAPVGFGGDDAEGEVAVPPGGEARWEYAVTP